MVSGGHIEEQVREVRAAIGLEFDRAEKFILTTHVTPDGDGLGAALALVRHLRSMGKDARVLNCSSAPHDLRWMYERGEFYVYNGGKHERLVRDADVIIATDIGGSERMGKMLDSVKASSAKKIVIDHHLYDNDVFDLPLIVSTASSSAEVTYDLLQSLEVPITQEIAIPLYVGLVSDTGGFAYSATSPRAHRMAAELMEAGVDPHEIFQQLNCQVPREKMRFLGMMLSRLNLVADSRVVWTSVNLDFLKRNETAPRDAFEVVNHFLRVKDVEVGAFFMEISKTKTKVSLRSNGGVDVCSIAKQFGGGGHRFAAGCTIDDKGLDDAIPVILSDLKKLLPEIPVAEVPAQ